jgi:hypothetical protein
MTEVSFALPRHQFQAASTPQPQHDQHQVPTTIYGAPPRCALQSGETFVPRGTSREALLALCPVREP